MRMTSCLTWRNSLSRLRKSSKKPRRRPTGGIIPGCALPHRAALPVNRRRTLLCLVSVAAGIAGAVRGGVNGVAFDEYGGAVLSPRMEGGACLYGGYDVFRAFVNPAMLGYQKRTWEVGAATAGTCGPRCPGVCVRVVSCRRGKGSVLAAESKESMFESAQSMSRPRASSDCGGV